MFEDLYAILIMAIFSGCLISFALMIGSSETRIGKSLKHGFLSATVILAIIYVFVVFLGLNPE